MHDRLENWALYCQPGRPAPRANPMFRLYKPDRDATYNPPEPRRTCDFADGMRMNALVINLPTAHRLSVQWFYITKDRPTKAVKRIQDAGTEGFSLIDLAEFVVQARDMMSFVNAAA
jgi:hypothetical protein